MAIPICRMLDVQTTLLDACRILFVTMVPMVARVTMIVTVTRTSTNVKPEGALLFGYGMGDMF